MKKLGKVCLTGCLVAVSLLVAGACGGGGGGGEEGGDTGGGGGDLGSLTLNIGTILPLTGDLSQFGPPMENGAKLAVQQIQDCNTMQINATYEDSGTNEQTAATAADKLINSDNVSVIVGAASSRVSFAVVDPAAQSGVVQISPASTSPDFTDYEDNGFFFRTTPSDALQGVVLADLAEQEGYETVNIIALNDDYGQGIARTFEENFGGEVAQNVAYDPTGTSFDSEVEQVSSGNPDAILVVAFPETGSIIMQAFAEQGVVGEVPFLFTDGMAEPSLPESSGVDLQGQRGTRPATEGPAADEFNQAYQQEYDSEPGTFSANSYDAVMLAALAAAAAGDTSGEAIRDNLQDVSRGGQEVLPSNICEGLEMAAAGEDINYEGAAGSQDFDDNGDVTSDYELWEFTSDGLRRVRIIEAPETS
ncbi:amino acid ABC transporter substrate-binding protein [Rubrobacter xylanophilus]|uniref:Amino acid ABC transporter substrate-binding protein n=1 Tax=Rubrobacter xylanophilus TaxID=49319 RepID=A0A510HL88_9ACTN|nr:ABC transporter substrate-binding protein [Rubrobacter xylanophilus]BBL80780.1 amino acid ABC transporter substrate-binding protein [Rubrobacter xylanophilus]